MYILDTKLHERNFYNSHESRFYVTGMNFDLYANKHCHCQVGSMLQKTFADIFSY